MAVVIGGQYARLSRGRIVAKHVATGEWGGRGEGTVTLDRVGRWMVSQTDGFARKETCYITITDDDEVIGLGRRMCIVEVA